MLGLFGHHASLNEIGVSAIRIPLSDSWRRTSAMTLANVTSFFRTRTPDSSGFTSCVL